MQHHLHRSHLVSLWRLLIASPGTLRMPQVASQQGSCHMKLDSRKHLTDKHILSISPDTAPDSSQILKSKPVEPVGFHRCI